MKPLARSDQQRLHQAREAMRLRELEKASSLYEQLYRRYPVHAPTVIELAQCYAALNLPDQTLRILDAFSSRIENSSGNDTGQGDGTRGKSLAIVCRTYDSIGVSERAFETAVKALQYPLDKPTEIYLRTIVAFGAERKNQLEMAAENCEFLLKNAADAPLTQMVAGLLGIRRKEWFNAQRHLQAVQHSTLPALYRAKAGYEMAFVLDQQDRFSEAWESIIEAKAIRLPNEDAAGKVANWLTETTLRITELISDQRLPVDSPINQTENQFQSDELRNMSLASDASAPEVCLLTGHPRSGTTLLEQILDAHPAIASADESSSLVQSIFDPLVGQPPRVPSDRRLALEAVDTSRLVQCVGEYRSRLEKLVSVNSPSDPRSRIEDDPQWLIDKNPEAVVLISTLQYAIPNCRVIVMLRDPRDVCLSCFMQFLPATPVGMSFRTLRQTAEKYARTMNLWLALRDKLSLNWLEVKYEDLVVQPRVIAGQVFDFLGVPFLDTPSRVMQHSASKTVHSPSYRAVANEINHRSIGRWKNYSRQFEEITSILDPFVQAFGY